MRRRGGGDEECGGGGRGWDGSEVQIRGVQSSQWISGVFQKYVVFVLLFIFIFEFRNLAHCNKPEKN